MKKLTLIVLILLMVTTMSLIVVFASTSVPGSPEDPVVTRSYVESKLAYEVLRLDKGQVLTGGAGTELIVRSGEVTAIDNGNDGVSDITAGADLRSGVKCQKNHLLLIPRADGRGIAASTEAYVMVRGPFTLN